MQKFDFKDIIGFTLKRAEEILFEKGYTNITHKVYSSSKVKNTDTLVVVKATQNKDNIELLVGEFLFNIDK